MSSKSIILILINYYLPGYKGGGPGRSVKNIVDHLGDEFEIKIITCDRDLGDALSYPDIIVDQWNLVEKTHVYYISPKKKSLINLIKLIRNTKYDVLYINSFFNPYFAIFPLLAIRFRKLPKRPLVIAPRGDLEKASLKIKSLKKVSYLFFSKMIGLYKNLYWQASSEYEAQGIRNIMGEIARDITVAQNLTPKLGNLTNSSSTNLRNTNEPFRICFISRISREKNLDYALHILRQVNKSIIFDIYGPQEDKNLWRECNELIKNQPLPILIRYMGSIEHEKIIETFKSYDLFFFPTSGENFGHVIIESMLAGTPVLIANTTPWRNLGAKGAGWDLPLDNPNLFIEKINTLSSMDPLEFLKLRASTYQFAKSVIANSSSYIANRQLFQNALNNN
jgi:glycosyltransferase involved in cell wall biosynthesis